jgi:FdhE protein
MRETWDSRIRRAEQLASELPESKELLTFYAALLHSQKEIYEYLRARRNWLPSGALEQDLSVLRVMISNLLRTVELNAPNELASQSRSLLEASESELDQILLNYWRAPSDSQFLAKAFLQPYASWLHETGAKPADRELVVGENRCPFCGGKPQLSVLHIKEATSESGVRDLICAVCLTNWPFRRVVCANCGEENPDKIGYFQSPEKYDHIRVEACDSCKQYIKAVDLTRYGFAVPLIDEVAAAPLDLWACERGYTKIEINLVGL